MLLLELCAGAALAAVDPRETAWVRYLDNTGREEAAEREARRLLEREPDDPWAHLTYLFRHMDDGELATRAVRQVYEAWSREDPTDDFRRVAAAIARAAELNHARRDPFPQGAAPWCDEVLPRFEPLPPAPTARAITLWQQIDALKSCERAHEAQRVAILAMESSVPAARFPAALARLEDDDVDAADAAAIATLVEAEPWRMDTLGLWRDTRVGAGLAAAREALVARARRLAASDDPLLLAAAIDVLKDAELDPEADPLITRLQEIDPERSWFPGRSEATTAPPTDAPTARPVETPDGPRVAPLGDAAATLAELDATREALDSRRARLTWWSRRATALATLGREREALHAWRRAYLLDPGVEANLRFAREAAARGRMLRAAEQAADVAVYRYSTPRPYTSDPNAEARADLAEALRTRARVRWARGDVEGMLEDARMSLLLEESRLARALVGLGLAEEGEVAAFGQLVQALAGGGSTGDAAFDDAARAALARLWPEQPWWTPTGLEGWLAAWSPREEREAAEAPVTRLPDVAVTVNGVETQLSALRGPAILDVWATWCGPCVQALPIFDAAAQLHPDVIFVALSVDEDRAKMADFLGEQKPAFQVGWGGKAAWEALGGGGIPAMYAIAADGRVVAHHVGYSPASDVLAQAVEAARGR